MCEEVRFVTRISKVTGNKLGVIVPEAVMKDQRKAELLRKWYENKNLIIVEIKKLDGMVQV